MLIKKIAFAIFCFAALVFAFHQSLVQWSIQLYFSHALSKEGFSLNYDQVYAKPNVLIFYSPEITRKDGQGKITAEALSIAYSFHPLEKTIDLEIECSSPDVELHACSNVIEKIVSAPPSSFSLVDIHVHFLSKNGKLKVNHDQAEQQFSFQIDHSTREGENKFYALTSKGEGYLNWTSEDGISKLNAHLFPIEKLNPLFHTLVPASRDWEIASGELNGALSFEKGHAKGSLAVRDGSLQHRKSQIKAKIPDLYIEGTKEHAAHLHFSNGSLAFADNALYGIMRGLKGEMVLQKDREFSLTAEGIWSAGEEDSHALIEAHVDLNNPKNAHFEIKLDPLDANRAPALIRVGASKPAPGHLVVHLNFLNLRENEFGFVQRALDNVDPDMSPVRYVSGTLNADATLSFTEGKLADVILDKMDIKEAFLLIKPLEIAVGSHRIAGNIAFDTALLAEGLNASLEIEGGKLIFTGINPDIWEFKNIQTKLEVKNGVVQESSGSIQLAGLKGTAFIYNSASPDLLHLALSGKVSDLKNFVPERVQNGINLSFADDEMMLRAVVKRHSEGVLVEGLVKTTSLTSENSPEIPFGFVASREAELQIKEGWFKADGLNLRKFIDPFLFPDRQLTLSGIADVKGVFDSSCAMIRYGGTRVQLENGRLMIDLPEIASFEASHTFNFHTGTNFGQLPFAAGSYFDKDTGLLFSDIHSKVRFEGKGIYFDQLEAFSNNLYLLGTADIDYSSEEKGAYTVRLHADTINGSFSAVQTFFEHFERPFFFTKIPLEGIVGTGPKGVDLFFDIREEDYDFLAYADAALSEGRIHCPNIDLSLHELAFNFTYDQLKKRLLFKDVQGMILLGKPDKLDEYSLHANEIVFSDFENNEGSFDVWIKDATQELARIKGVTRQKGAAIEVLFDLEKSHFGGLYADKLSLLMTDWSRIDKMELISQFDMRSFMQMLERFEHSEALGVSKRDLKRLKKVNPLEGQFLLHLGFDGEKTSFDFDLDGRDIAWNHYAFHEVKLNGYNRDERWIIDQLKLDQLSFAAEMSKKEDLLHVGFLGVRFGDALKLGLEGEYDLALPAFRAKVNMFEIDLDNAKEWQMVMELISSVAVSGKIKGNGDIHLIKNAEGILELRADLDAALNGVMVRDAAIGEGSRFKLKLNTNEGVVISDFHGSYHRAGTKGAIDIKLKKLAYDFPDEALAISGLKFGIDAEILPWSADALNRYLPRVIDRKVAEYMGQLKKTGVLRGTLDLESSSTDKNFRLSLDEGNYQFHGEERHLSNISMDYQQEELKIVMLYHLNQHPVWLSARVNPKELHRGSVLLADGYPGDEDHPALTVEWRDDPESGFIVERISGYLAGMTVELRENKKHHSDAYAFRLSGQIGVDGKSLRPMLSGGPAEVVDALELGSGYRLLGDFELKKGADQEVRFFGTMTGRDIELKGYRFDHMSSQVILEPASFQLLNCTISDLAGTLHIANLRADKLQDGTWMMQVPLVSMHELRPSILREADGVRPLRKPLVIREFYLQGITGVLGQLNTFRGSGELNFVNPQKRYTQNVLFSIPAEILTRIGLNLSVLTPVTGTIHFDLNNGHFVLKKFKDVYSEGKISKFYLPSSGAPSTIALDGGKVNVQVRFKQSTLLLKLAELFTITVKGNVKNPRYSLQRQKYLKQEELFSSDVELEGVL